MIGQKRARTSGSPPELIESEPDGSQKVIKVQSDVRLLGANIQDNMGWNAHLETGEDAMIPETRKKLGILKHIGRTIPLKSRKLVAEGIVISRIRYLISLWGSTTDRLQRNTQTLMNDCARYVLGEKGRRTSTMELMSKCGWMSVEEMCQHSTLLILWKALRQNSPNYLSEKISIDDDNKVKTNVPRILHTTYGLRWRATYTWNLLPDHIRAELSYNSFKLQTKRWILDLRQQTSDRDPG